MKPALIPFRPAGSIGLSALLVLSGVAIAAEPQVFTGEPVVVGNGSARVVMALNAENEPESVSVLMTRDALEGLPEASAEQEFWEFSLPMPDGAPVTGYDHVVLDWNPVGHPPEGVYDLPHFDVHFYLIGTDEQEAITFHGEGRELAMAAPDPQLVPEGYVIPPDAAVERMGMHGLDPAGAEFQGELFSHNFIYGYYKGELMFVEPMVSLAYLQSLPEMSSPVKKPQRYSYPGWYPGTYQIGYDAGKGEYRIAIRDLQRYD
ncbi:DUF5602 domain-containing protein [Marinobacter sp. F4218]|uniref:DUF5602 domain-containing protein n=1 Tax=Marinobacter sp. F4218 TaxID=2862868 RepID=UPI001C62F450|nr:DUF5602 domain-containing protein [Marinobacter sp. F4218]MBW7472584.1 DUF5602 domain-containing protein [Marinobacter sp. F4218]